MQSKNPILIVAFMKIIKIIKGQKYQDGGRQGETALQELRWRPGSV